MKINKVTTVTKKQAKAYTVITLNTLAISPNDLSIKEVWEEIEEIMKLYTPRDAVGQAEKILEKKGGDIIWMKK